MKEKEISFCKLHGAGNDFILLNGFVTDIQLKPALIEHWCDRHFGIGADGLIMLIPSTVADFQMIYYNADGYEGSMCGNGGRSAAAFAYLNGLARKEGKFMAFDGMHSYKILHSDEDDFDIELTMSDVNHYELTSDRLVVNTGSPHCVVKTSSLSSLNVYEAGRSIRYHTEFAPEGINVNFIEAEGEKVTLRTYERGVENETLSCGTGVTAAAIALALWENRLFSKINTAGGLLSVSLQPKEYGFTNIILRGPVKFVFEGKTRLAE